MISPPESCPRGRQAMKGSMAVPSEGSDDGVGASVGSGLGGPVGSELGWDWLAAADGLGRPDLIGDGVTLTDGVGRSDPLGGSAPVADSVPAHATTSESKGTKPWTAMSRREGSGSCLTAVVVVEGRAHVEAPRGQRAELLNTAFPFGVSRLPDWMPNITWVPSLITGAPLSPTMFS